MISKRIMLNLVVFATAAALLVGYGVVSLFGNPFDQQRTVVADLPEAGGLRPGFSASHDGVVIGTVDRIQLLKGKVRVTVVLDKGKTVPRGVRAQVVRASAVGEQRLDLVSVPGGSRETLPDGGHVRLAEHPIPPDVADVLKTVTDFVDALPTKDLNTLVHELATGIDGRAGDLKAINRALAKISDDVVEMDPDFRKLLDDGPAVLDDFTRMSPEFHQALTDTDDLTRILANDDDAIVSLLRDGSDVAKVADRLILQNRTNLTCLFGDVGTLNHALQGQALKDMDRGFAINQLFFGLIDKLAVRGHAADVGYGGHARDDQLWLRTKLLVPNQNPPAIAYTPPRKPLPVRTGKACKNTYGSGVAATPEPSRDLGKTDGPDAPATSTAPSAEVASHVTDLGDAVPAGQAREAPASNRDLVPLFILGVGIAVAAVTALPTARTRRRAR